MKDVPTWLPDGTVLPCMLQREETNDVFISKKYKSLKDLPDGAVIGSASLRRHAQLLATNPSWKVVNFRGNVQTRLRKIEEGTCSLPTPFASPSFYFWIVHCGYILFSIQAW
jgi:hydroxymethylbilane synthase